MTSYLLMGKYQLIGIMIGTWSVTSILFIFKMPFEGSLAMSIGVSVLLGTMWCISRKSVKQIKEYLN